MGLACKRKNPESGVSAAAGSRLSSLNHGRMGLGRIKECLAVLKGLMDHQFGWVFNQPVDPVKLGIPDYFSIIKNPMDLGTVKEKLLNRKYERAAQFAEDVRLTFSNAMRYNPPENEVHVLAVELSDLFDARWRVLEDEWVKGTSNVGLGSVEDKFRRKENVNSDSRRVENGSARKKPNVRTAGAENVRPSNLSKNARTLVQGAAQASCKGGGLDRSQSAIRIEKQSDHGRLVLKVGSYSDVNEFCLEEPLSPTKALRAAMLKRRFAGTIAKAQQRSPPHQGNKGEVLRLQLEKERLERKHHEEELRLEAKIRAVEAAARIKAEADRKLKREKEREAARVALQQVKKTVDLDNTELLRELERLNCSWTWYRHRTDAMKHSRTHKPEKSGFLNPLEKLGLFIKDDGMKDEDLEIQARDIEEGIVYVYEMCFSHQVCIHLGE